jgi:hypothetical protein
MKTKIVKAWKALQSSKFVLLFVTLWSKFVALFHKVFIHKTYYRPVINNSSEYFKYLVTEYKDVMLQPFIITLENTGTEIVKDVEILNAVKRFKLNFNLGWEGSPELKISYGIPGISYEDFLASLLSYKYVINQIRLSYSKIVPIEDFMMTYEGKEINGNSHSFPILTLLDKNQYVQTVIDIHKEFNIDCFTSLKIKQIPPLTKVHIYLYPILRY